MNFLNEWIGFIPALLSGLWVSLKLTGFSLLIGLPVGLLLALGASSKNRPLRLIVIIVVEIGRGTPALVVLQLFYYGLPSAGLTLASFTAAGLALALTTAAYTSEILRGGLQAVPAGEVEAAHALGMRHTDTLRYVVIPQGVRVALPPLMGFAILVLQMTSLAFTIALPELLSRAYSIGSSSFQYMSVLILAGLLYSAVTIPASWLCERVEKRLARHL